MKTKTCNKCNIEKETCLFYNKKGGKCGLSSICKDCTYKRNRLWVEKNKDKIKNYLSEYKDKNKNHLYEKDKEYRIINKAKIKNSQKDRYEKDKEKILEKQKEYYLENKDAKIEYVKNWRINNKKKWIESRAKRKQERYSNDINFKLKNNIVSRLNLALRHNRKSNKTEVLLGCTIAELRIYLENKFKEGMSWDNRFEWHIDHIIPCASFDLSKEEEQKKCFHYSNLQPLWARENIIKGSKNDNADVRSTNEDM